MEQNQAPEWAVVGAEAYIENRSSYEDRIGAKVVITKVLKTCVVVEGENHNGKFERRYRIEWNGSLVRTKKAGADEYVDENHWRRDRLVSLAEGEQRKDAAAHAKRVLVAKGEAVSAAAKLGSRNATWVTVEEVDEAIAALQAAREELAKLTA